MQFVVNGVKHPKPPVWFLKLEHSCDMDCAKGAATQNKDY